MSDESRSAAASAYRAFAIDYRAPFCSGGGGKLNDSIVPRQGERFSCRRAPATRSAISVAASRAGSTAAGNETRAKTNAGRRVRWIAAFFIYGLVGLGILNTILMSVMERTREFGVLRAIGTRPGRVVAQVFGESFWIAILSGILGLAAGL